MAKRSGRTAKLQRQLRASERKHRELLAKHAQGIYYQISRGRLVARA